MSLFMRSTFALLLLSGVTAAQAQFVGQAFPLTNTRYTGTSGIPLLRTDGKDLFLFWRSDTKLHATRLADERDRAGHVVLGALKSFDVAWTGEGFMALASQPDGTLLGRLLDAQAHPRGKAFPVAASGYDGNLAASGDRVLVTYKAQDRRTHLLLLTSGGMPAGMSGVLHGSGGRAAVAGTATGFIVARMTAEGTAVTALNREGFVTRQIVIGDSPRIDSNNIGLASNGRESLLTWSWLNEIVAMPVSAEGVPGAPVLIHETGQLLPHPSAAWNGDGWSVAYRGPSGNALVAHLDREALRVVSREQNDTLGWNHSLAALGKRMFLAWSSTKEYASAQMVPLPFGGNQPRDVTFAPARQTHLATSSSSNGTLVVWHEQSGSTLSIRAGVRGHDGSWSEYEITASETYFSSREPRAAAANDGRNFVVLLDRRSGVEAVRLDGSGRPIGLPLPISDERLNGLTWSGREYAIITGDEGRLLTPDGVLSAPVPISVRGDWIRSVASNGSGFLVTSGMYACEINQPCYPLGLFAARFGPDLKRLESSDIVLSETSTFKATRATDVLWNGSEYVTAWRSGMAGIAPTPYGGARILAVDVDLQGSHLPAATLSGSALTIASSNGTLTTVSDAGTVLTRMELDAHSGTSAPGLASLPHGTVAYIATSVQDEAPFGGASRLMMRIIGPSVPSPPSPPEVTVSQSDTRWTVAWKAPAGVLNGYRVEYRIDDGSWIELERWFQAGESGISIRRPYAGAQVAVRVRAFNDGGVSDYSNVATPPAVRRRAVR